VGQFRSTLFITFWIALVVSGINPSIRIVWVLQCIVPVAMVSLLFFYYRRMLPTKVTCFFVWLQCILLLVGAHYRFHMLTLFRIQLPDGTTRGYVDWIVHLVDGIAFTLLTRDILSQFTDFQSKKLFRSVIILICLGLAALWELVEWTALIVSKDAFSMNDHFAADSYVDMLMTLVGSLLIIYWIKPILKNDSSHQQ